MSRNRQRTIRHRPRRLHSCQPSILGQEDQEATAPCLLLSALPRLPSLQQGRYLGAETPVAAESESKSELLRECPDPIGSSRTERMWSVNDHAVCRASRREPPQAMKPHGKRAATRDTANFFIWHVDCVRVCTGSCTTNRRLGIRGICLRFREMSKHDC